VADQSAYQETQLVQAMKLRNRPVRAIINGSATIRNSIENKNGETEPSIVEYIKQEDGESKQTYINRLLRTYVTPLVTNAVTSASGQIFKNPITYDKDQDFPDRIQNAIDNVDLMGSDLNEWCMSATEESLSYGMAIAFVDFNNPSGSSNLSEQQSTGARPFLKLVSYFDLLGYSFDNQGRITMLRFREEASIEDEFLGADRVEQVRRITPTGYKVYRKDEKGQEQLADSGEIIRFDEKGKRITDRVPIAVMYGRKLGVLNSASVFEDLAYINLQHTQVNSDLSWNSHFYLIPFLFAVLGSDAEPPEDGTPLVPRLASYVNVTLPTGSTLNWVETNGNAYKAGSDYLASIEKRADMSKMDSSVSVSSGTRETATGRALDASSTSAKLKLHAEAVESFAKNIIEIFASYIPEVTLPDFTVEANKEFDLVTDSQMVKDLSLMNTSKQLSLETMLNEMKRRGVLGDNVDVTQELERISEDMAAEGMI
jgi:hypothetical protein